MLGVMYILWLIAARGLFANHQTTAKVVLGVVAVLCIASFVESIDRNLMSPYSTSASYETGRLAVVYRETLAYQIMNGLNSISFLLVGYFFWKQGKAAPDLGQQLRIRSLAVGFIFLASAFIVTPTFPLADQPKVSTVIISASLLVMGIANLIGSWLSLRSRSS